MRGHPRPLTTHTQANAYKPRLPLEDLQEGTTEETPPHSKHLYFPRFRGWVTRIWAKPVQEPRTGYSVQCGKSNDFILKKPFLQLAQNLGGDA